MGASHVWTKGPDLGLAHHVGIYELDLLTGVITLSDDFADKLGLPSSATLDELWERYIHPDDHERVQARLMRAIAEGSCVDIFRLRSQTGWAWVCARSAVGLDADGEAVRLAGVAVDVSPAVRERGPGSDSLQGLTLALCGVRTGAWSYDRASGWVSVSRDLQDLFGLAAVEISAPGLLALLQPEDGARLDRAGDRALASGEAVHEEVLLAGSNSRLFRVLGERVVDPLDGKVLGLHGVIWEVTDEGVRNLESEATRNRLEMALSSGKMGAWDLDLRTRRLSWGQECALLFGFSAESFGNTIEGFWQHVHPEDRITLESLLDRTPDQGRGYRSSYRIVEPSGQVRYFRSVGSFEFDGAGHPIALRGVAHDVTELVSFERELREANEQLNLALSSAGMGTWEYNLMTEAHTGSEIASQMYETVPVNGVLPADQFWSRVHPDYHGHLRDRMAHALMTGERFEATYPLVLPSGTQRWVATTGQVHYDPEGRPFEVVGVVQDITSRKAFESRLEQANERLSLALDSADMGTWEYHLESKRHTGSSITARMFEFPEGETSIPIEVFWNRVHPDYQQMVRTNIRKALAGDGRYSALYPLVLPSGTPRWVSVMGMVHYRPDGMPFELVGVVQDITARKQFEANLEQANERLSLALDFAALGIWEIDVASNAAWFSDTAYRMYGFDPAHPPKKDQMAATIFEEDREANIGKFISTVDRGTPYETTYRIRRPDGEVRHMASVGRLVPGKLGRSAQVLGIVQDVTERVHARESLEQLNERLTLALEAAGLGMWAIPAGEDRLDAHESLYRLFGVDKADYNERDASLFDLVDPEDLGKNVEHFYDAQNRGETYRTEYRIRRPDGERRWLSSLGKTLADGRGNRIFLAVTQDVTERKEVEQMLEERVAERTRELQDALTALETFSHSVSHDLRAPLRAIGGYARALREDHEEQLGEEGAAMAQRIQAAVHKADRLVSDLLTFSRVSREEVHLEAVDVEDCVREALLQHETELRRKNAQLDIRLAGGDVFANRATLTQVLANLISNAVKFVPSDRVPEIAIESREVSGQVEIAVLDNGVGVEPEHRESIFEPFVRLYSERQFPGTGIGLAIVSRAVGRMGGAVGVEARDPDGSRFWIRLSQSPR